ncbi:hypothetical protein EVAR_95853_1 [Eumeta japonica]|uniref:Uncharacterized protein n=1 Tax=Eumeta variegata TaxID=151549 RepID=A0A4C1VLG0_EUMVA|nr:hypothetical protein EVAR_95853_1 [Eumeta japonica]
MATLRLRALPSGWKLLLTTVELTHQFFIPVPNRALKFKPFPSCTVACVDGDMFRRERVVLETEMGVRTAMRHFPEIMEHGIKREMFLKLCLVVVDKCRNLNRN